LRVKSTSMVLTKLRMTIGGGKLRNILHEWQLAAPFFHENSKAYTHLEVCNLSLSRCYNCSEIAIWVYDRLVWPRQGDAPLPNPDTPADIRADYDEASSIIDLSPRGAAALLRLAIQKLCRHFGEKGDNINDDIASLVRKGLPQTIQQALDVVRVIGNESVHPGQMDLRDDRATAEQLFDLVNLIVDDRISQPARIGALYAKLPEAQRRAIEQRDGTKA
jgi:hypothetical protein